MSLKILNAAIKISLPIVGRITNISGVELRLLQGMAMSCSLPLLRPFGYYPGSSCHIRRLTRHSRSKSGVVYLNTRPSISCAISMTDGQSGDNGNVNLDHMMERARKFWDELPQPVKIFPWNKVLDNFIQFILDVVVAVVKYLSVPVLAVSSLSEMSYCAHERILFLVPIPLLLGFAVAGVFLEAASELSPLIKDAEVPWHLITATVFFTILKLPGPYYPYWGRVFIPHFANGGLVRIFWMMYLWNRKPKEGVDAAAQRSSESSEQS